MTDEERLEAARSFAAEKHEGQFRKGGEKYIVHPISVSKWLKENGFDVDTQIAGLFHDLLEDTDATEEEILSLSNEHVLEAVKLLTKKKGYVMSEYVAGIKQNEMARAVKTADRLDNLRDAVVCSEEFKRKYILETLDWYTDLSPEIVKAMKDLSKTLESPLSETSLEYDASEPGYTYTKKTEETK